MKKIYVGIIMLLVSLSILKVDVMAAKKAYDDNIPRVVDESDLLDELDEERLEKKLDKLRDKWNFDVVVVTVDSLEGYSVVEFADDFFDYGGYGYGDGSINRDGILLLVSMSEREWAISTSGSGLSIFTDYGTDYIGEKVVNRLSDGEYYLAFTTFADYVDKFAEHYDKTGRAYDYSSPYRSMAQLIFGIIIRFIICLVVGLIAAAIRISGMKAKMSTVSKQYEAKEYVVDGAVKINVANDNFVRTAVSKSSRSTSSGSGGGGYHGGTSSHHSSSGGSHGGSHGRF